MARTWGEVTRLERYRVAESIICDRCGKDAEVAGGSAELGSDAEGVWGVVHGLIQGGQRFDGDLCRSCVEELEDWINAGSGGGVKRTPE